MADYPFEIYECGEWIQEVLEADTGPGGLFETGSPMVNGAFMDLVPEGIKLPAIRYHVQAPLTVRGIGPSHQARIMTQLDWLVVVMREGHHISPLVPIVMRLDTVLDGRTGSNTLVDILSCTMVEPFQILETDKSGVHIRHAGGIYRTVVTPK